MKAEINGPVSRRIISVRIVLFLPLMSAWFAEDADPDATQIPTLRWEERSDWVNVKTEIAPAARGDGQAER